MIDYQLSRPFSMGWHPSSWVLRIHSPGPDVLRGSKTSLTRWLRERRGTQPFHVHLIVRADFGPFGGAELAVEDDGPTCQ